jgi:NTE family protein
MSQEPSPVAPNTEPKYPFRGLILEGGGPAGVAHIGGLKILKEKGILDQIDHFVGSSAGAIVASTLACKADLNYISDLLFKTDFKTFMDDSWGVFRDVARFIKSYGWFKGDQVEIWMGRILKDITGNPNITFVQAFEKYGTFLEVTVTDLNLGTTVYINHKTFPHMKIKTAVRRSAMIPLFFKADTENMPTEIFENNKLITKDILHYFVDGGLLNNYPIQRLDGLIPKEQVIGMKLVSSKELDEMKVDLPNGDYGPKNIIEYLTTIYVILRNQALKVHINEYDWNRTLHIDVGTISATDFNLSDVDKHFLIDQGTSAANKFLNNWHCCNDLAKPNHNDDDDDQHNNQPSSEGAEAYHIVAEN